MSGDDERGGWLLRVLLPVLLSVLLVAVIAVSVVLWRERSDEPNTAADAGSQVAEARAVAEEAATAFFSLDHRQVEADIAAARELMTEEFGVEYEREAASLQREVVMKMLVLTPSLLDDGTATESFSDDAAQVLVSVDVTTTAPGDVTDEARYRTRVALVRSGDTWLVSGLDQVG
ncbi:MAG: hypothetical protein WB767_08670 [Nocardioides sp.]